MCRNRQWASRSGFLFRPKLHKQCTHREQINRSKSLPILTVVGLHPNCTQKKYRSHTLSPQGATEIAVGHFSHQLSKEIK